MASRRGNRVFLWIVMGLLAVGLVGYGTGNFGGGRTDIGTVGDKPVPAQIYATALQRQIDALGEQLGQPLTFEEAQGLGADRAALARTVAAVALDVETERLGLSVGDARIAAAVRDLPGFQGPDGAFDRALYADTLRRNGLDERTFEASLRDETARTLLQAAVLTGVPEPAAAADALARHNGERRVVTWAPLAADALAPSLPEPTEDELRAYYEANPEAFTAPEVRDVSYAWLTPEMIRDGIAVDESEVRALYDERIDEYVQEERRLVERLVYPSEEEAAAARARLDAGEATFEELVAERGLQLADIDLGDVARAELGPAADAAFAAEVGAVVGPATTDLGPALFRVNAVLAAQEVPPEEAAPDLRTEIADGRARDAIADAVPEIEDLVAGGATIEDLAERTDLEAGTVAWSEGVTDGIAAYDAFRAAAAAAQEGDLPEVVELEDGGVFVLRLDGVTPPALRPYEEVADEVAAGLRAERLEEAVIAEATAKAEAIADGATFEDQGLAPTTEPPLTRRDVVEGTPPEFMATAFGLAQGGTATLPTATGAVVLRVDEVQEPAAEDPGVAAERDALAAQLQESLARDLFAAFATQLQVNTEVRIDDAAVAAVNAQFQ